MNYLFFAVVVVARTVVVVERTVVVVAPTDVVVVVLGFWLSFQAL
jgi:hypothetical protein